ncbi:MAG: serine/threonine protein kinase [Alphaproteobacteria bacterium]|nr:serine/threonine protein kinase [Alphaproteobacteria bacterium]MCB9695291.1 serine/threonine protein kinase [Alphaproteobacteria bacterium]
MADVWRAHDDDGVAWALKVLTQTRPEARERFVTEARIQLSLDHPNLVRAREVVEDDQGDPILVMEYVEGASLDRWLFAREATLEQRDRIAAQILAGVGYAHGLGLVHRDLKPGNVLVMDADEGPVAKVTDFGLAKDEQAASATRSNIALGTPRYMAPEQIRDAKRVDARADIWSLGTLLYELYTEEAAFHRDSLADIFIAVVDGTYRDPAELGAPPRVCAAIRACLQGDPALRPESTAALEALLFPAHPPPAPTLLPPSLPPTDEVPPPLPEPPRAEPPPPPQKVARHKPIRVGRLALPWIAGWGLALGLVLLLFGAGVAGVAIYSWSETTEVRPAPPPPPPAPRIDRRGKRRNRP